MTNSHRTRSARGLAGHVAVVVATVAAVLAGTLVIGVATGTQAGAAGPTLTVTPSTGLVDGQTASVLISGASAGTTYVVVECDPTAFSLLAQGASPSDGCDSRHNAVVTVDAGGAAATTLQPQAVLTTALGPSDCRSEQCFIAADALYATGGSSSPLVAGISFSSGACSGRHSCTPPADAWDPSIGTGAHDTATESSTARSARPGHPVQVDVTAGQAGDLVTPGTVTGPYRAPFPPPDVPATPVSGEGLVRLALSSPRTSWGARLPSSTVVDVTVTDTTRSETLGTQQFVLFDGDSPFVYAGFAGPATTADAYRVTVQAEPSHAAGGLSWPADARTPHADVVDAELEVVGPADPAYLATAYAPVMFGRSTSALHDVPLLVDATATPQPGGATRLSYTFIWSHEDAGTGFVPFLEWGTWGRMTDIENAISFTVAADGTVSGATYLWGGEPPTGFPDSQGALQEVDVPFAGQWDGHHPVLRDATGNNDFSDAGTTPFRFQLAPVAGPAPGQTRESVMDANPFTYQISGEEVTRWYGDVSTDPRSPEPGDARQYATVDLDVAGTGVTSVAVELQLAGDPTWYASDFHSGYPAHTTGHFRTVVKLPEGWQGRPVTAVGIQVYPASAAPSVTVGSLTVLALQPDWRLTVEPVPAPSVTAGAVAVPPALGLAATSGTHQVVRAGGSTHQLQAVVTSSLGVPLAGVPVTFSSGSPGLRFAGCGCPTLTAVTDRNGNVSSGRAVAPATAGTIVVTASTPDTAVPAVAYDLTIRR